MSFYVNHPDEWIGTPEYWPFPQQGGTELLTPEAWVDAVVDEIHDRESLGLEEREHVGGLLQAVTARAAESGLRHFVAFREWQGPAYVVETEVFAVSWLGGRSIEDFLGANDPERLDNGVLEPVTTESGLSGTMCVRYLTYDAVTQSIYGRVDIGFIVEGQVFVFRAIVRDGVEFERLRPALESLVRTLRWEDD